MGMHILVCEKAPSRADEGAMPAGTVVDQGTGAPRKIRWTWSELEKHYPRSTWKTFISPINQRIEWNRLVVIVAAGQESTIPPIHYDILMESIKSDRDISSPRQPSDYRGRSVPYEGVSGVMVVGMGTVDHGTP